MRLQKVISKVQPEVIPLGELRVAKLSHTRAFSQLDAKSIDAVVVDDDELLSAALMDDRLYLLPLFVTHDSVRQCDGKYQFHDTTYMINKINVILEKIAPYQELSLPDDPKERFLTKLIRYLLSRHVSLDPKSSRHSSIGYMYTLVEDMSIEKDPLHILRHLDEFASQNYFNASPIDKINICYECQGSYLNFSECCTKCNSIDLKSEELVHHFRCAYVGPKSDFIHDEKLICPKCDHQLKHIGIDYDKPSEIQTCRSCNHQSQETKMKAVCVDCNKENELDQLVTFTINSYKPTEKAKEYAMKTVSPPRLGDIQMTELSAFIPYATYSLLKTHESKKVRLHDLSSYEIEFVLDPLMLAQLNENLKVALYEELAFIIKPYFKDNDLLSYNPNGYISSLLVDYDLTSILEVQSTLQYNLTKMLNDNGYENENVISITMHDLKS